MLVKLYKFGLECLCLMTYGPHNIVNNLFIIATSEYCIIIVTVQELPIRKERSIMVKRVRKYGEGRMTLCAETGNRCFGRAVYEDLHTGGLAVIVSLVSGDFLVDLDTFLNAHRFFEDMEVLG